MGTGIPVPAVIPEGSKAFILCVPDDPFFYGVVMGALKVMTFRYYWQGSSDQIDAVTERMLTMYYDYQEQVGCMICEMIAQCFTDQDPGLMAAVAEAMRSNPLLLDAISQGISENGGGTPGKPISEQQAQQDTLPENVRDEEGECIPDALWGAMLYAVQSGNRGITDFFQILQAAVEVVEASAIILQNVPAVGGYAASAAQFAAKMQTVIAANYAAAYTESYEESLACDLFCRARVTCDLSIDDFIVVLNARLTAPLDIGDMGEIMVGIGSGTWVGDEVADVAFLVYFSALKFGQQFGDKIGIRPLTQLMSLGADQLASDNWETLCDCPEYWSHDFDFTIDEQGWVAMPGTPEAAAIYNAGFGWEGNYVDDFLSTLDVIRLDLSVVPDTTITGLRIWFETDSGSGNETWYTVEEGFASDRFPTAAGVYENQAPSVEPNIDLSTGAVTGIVIDISKTGTAFTRISKIRLAGAGSDPFA